MGARRNTLPEVQVTHPTARFDPAAPDAPAARRLTITRSWGRGLAVLGLVTVCAIPAGAAVAAGHGRAAQHRGTVSRVVKPIAHRTATPVRRANPLTPVTSSTTDSSITRSTISTASKPRVDDGRWWPWGSAVHGTLSVVGQDGVTSAVTLQRGAISAVTASTITVTSADGTSLTWTLDATTGVTGLPRQSRRQVPVVAADALTTTTDPSTETSTSTSTSTSTAPMVASTTGLVVGQVVGVWGSGTKAQSVIVHSTPRATPTTTVTVTVTATANMAG
jgi:hypothetical protein